MKNIASYRKIEPELHINNNNLLVIKKELYVLKSVEFRGYVYEKNGIEVQYLNKLRQDKSFLIQMTQDFVKYIENKKPSICKQKKDKIYFENFVVKIPSNKTEQEQFFCYKDDKEVFIFQKPNEKKLTDAFLVYIFFDLKGKEGS